MFISGYAVPPVSGGSSARRTSDRIAVASRDRGTRIRRLAGRERPVILQAPPPRSMTMPLYARFNGIQRHFAVAVLCGCSLACRQRFAGAPASSR